MTGIVSYGGHVPKLRLDHKLPAAAWGRHALGGERSVANNDEDSATMAVEAAANCLNGRSRQDVEALFFASTTAPYQEKMSSALIATALDLRREVVTTDYANSLRSGTSMLLSAMEAVRRGSFHSALITGADCRVAYPKSDFEQNFGDGAGALLLGRDNPVATLECSYSVNNEMMDVWRKREDTCVQTWETRFVLEQGYTAVLREAISGVMNKYEIQPDAVSRVIVPAPNSRAHGKLLASMGFDVETQAQDPLLSTVGFCGAAHPLMMLTAALESAGAGDLLLLAAYGDGADAMLFRVTDQIGGPAGRHPMSALIADKMMIPSYARFLSYQNLLEAQPAEAFRLLPSATVSWREQRSTIRCHASRCNQCGCTVFPVQRICYNCRSKDDFEEVRLSGRHGEIFTFTRDNLGGRSDDPVIVQTVAEMEGGIRFYGLMTDCDPDGLDLGTRVTLTFRKMHEGAGFHNYFWKLKPVQNGGDN
jgi:3-hydroxy-3-methylglutaryl CoA synthase